MLQHHDAITGTEKAAVAADYVSRLHEGWGDASKVVAGAVARLLFAGEAAEESAKVAAAPGRRPIWRRLKLLECTLANVSLCAPSVSVSAFLTPPQQLVRLAVAGA